MDTLPPSFFFFSFLSFTHITSLAYSPCLNIWFNKVSIMYETLNTKMKQKVSKSFVDAFVGSHIGEKSRYTLYRDL